MAQWITQSICSGASISVLPDWMLLSFTALAVSAVFLGFLYIVSIVFGNQGLGIFTKYEMFEIGATVFIIILIMTFSTAMCSVKVKDILPNNPPPQFSDLNLYDASFEYVESVDARLIGWMTATQIFALYMDQFASTTIYAKPLSMGLITSPGAGSAGPIKSMLYQMNNAMAVAFIVNHAQINLLEFAMYGFVNFFFPIGIVLRSFTPTRRLGGSLIAIGLGFLLVYPILTVASAYIMYAPVDKLDASIWSNFQDPVEMMEDSMSSADMGEFKEWMKNSVSKPDQMVNSQGSVIYNSNFDSSNPVSSLGGETKTATDVVWNIFNGAESGVSGFLKGALYNILMIPMSALSMGFIMAMVLPAINVLILVQAIKSMSRVIGDEIDISVLTRLI